MTAFIGSFLQYGIIMVLLAAIAAVGAAIGMKMRENKDAKSSVVRTEPKKYNVK